MDESVAIVSGSMDWSFMAAQSDELRRYHDIPQECYPSSPIHFQVNSSSFCAARAKSRRPTNFLSS